MALGPELVEVCDGRFSVAGSPFPVVGANNYYLAYASDRMRGDVIAAASQIGLNVLRAWAFLDCKTAKRGETPEGSWRGVWFQCRDLETGAPRVNEGENGLCRLDRLIADAERAGMRLILPLVNYWPDFGGMDRYVEWFGGGPRDRFYRDERIRDAFQSYVAQVLTRSNTVTGRLYRDEPAILAWELANEPECPTRDGRRVLLEWVREMSRSVKRNDPNHLLAVGDQGYFAGGSGWLHDGCRGVDTEAFLRVPEIDFGTVHLYPQSWKQADPVQFGIRWIEEHLAAGQRSGKPVLLEEYGMKIGRDGAPSAHAHNSVYGHWLNAVLRQNGAGDLAWMLASRDDATGDLYPDYDHFTFYSADDVPSIRDHALQMICEDDAERFSG
jgi:mannan endo-1,4-beta-mannosidase